MAQDDFLAWPEDVQELIDDIGTVEGVDVMCLLSRHPSRAWRLDQICDELALDRYALEDSVRRLVIKGLVDRLSDGTLRNSSSSPERTATVKALSNLCDDDRANVLGAIAHFSISRIRTSAVRTFVRKSRDER